MDVGGKVVVVTGAASGIGYALAASFARDGAQVVLADIHADVLEEAAAEVGGVAVPTDVSDPDAVDALYARQYNPADEWITPTQCAGTGPVICIWTSPTQELRVQLDQSPSGWKVSKAVFSDR